MENQEMLIKANLNWDIEVRKLITAGDNPIETENIAIVRTDTNQILGVHGHKYMPYQNTEMADILNRISGKMDLPLYKGGYFGEGEKTFIQLKTSDINIPKVGGMDMVKGYLTCINSYDGSTSLAFGHSNTTISCQNTFFASYKEVANKVRHTAAMHGRVDLICAQIEEVLRKEQLIYDTITGMSNVGITDNSQVIAKRLKQKGFGSARELALTRILNLEKEERLADLTTLSTRKRNILSDLEININGEIADKGGNIWGLFSGITKYTTHSLKGDSTENKLFGVYGNRERELFGELAQLVS
jgi:hypothetical protein